MIDHSADMVKVSFDEAKWNRLWQRMKQTDIAIGGAKSRAAVNKSAGIIAQYAKQIVAKDTGALQASITTKATRAKGAPVIWGGIGIQTKSLYVSRDGKMRRPNKYYYILEKGRTSDERRASNEIANRINPNRKQYKNNTKRGKRDYSFLRPAINTMAPTALDFLYHELVRIVDNEMEKAAR